MTERTREEERAVVLASLVPLFAEARAEGLWFNCHYQDLWFSPDELAAEHVAGRFCWGAVNWELRSPHDRIKQLEQALERAHEELRLFHERVR